MQWMYSVIMNVDSSWGGVCLFTLTHIISRKLVMCTYTGLPVEDTKIMIKFNWPSHRNPLPELLRCLWFFFSQTEFNCYGDFSVLSFLQAAAQWIPVDDKGRKLWSGLVRLHLCDTFNMQRYYRVNCSTYTYLDVKFYIFYIFGQAHVLD